MLDTQFSLLIQYFVVGCYPFDDHNAPPFELILQFCKDVQDWLKEHEQNIAVIHCKAGKGRTGLMICAFLLFSREWKTPEEALNFYAAMRTVNKKGVTIPSQICYVHYFHESLVSFETPTFEPKFLILNKVVLHTLPKVVHVNDVNFTIHVGRNLIFTYKDYVEKTKARDEPKVVRVNSKKKKKEEKEKEKEKKKEKDKKKEKKEEKEKDKDKEKDKENGEKEDKDKEEDKKAEAPENGKDEEPETPQEENIPHSLNTSNNNNNISTPTATNGTQNDAEETATFDCGMSPIYGDVKIEFDHKGSKIFAFWFNTAFVKDLRLVVK